MATYHFQSMINISQWPSALGLLESPLLLTTGGEGRFHSYTRSSSSELHAEGICVCLDLTCMFNFPGSLCQLDIAESRLGHQLFLVLFPVCEDTR